MDPPIDDWPTKRLILCGLQPKVLWFQNSEITSQHQATSNKMFTTLVINGTICVTHCSPLNRAFSILPLICKKYQHFFYQSNLRIALLYHDRKKYSYYNSCFTQVVLLSKIHLAFELKTFKHKFRCFLKTDNWSWDAMLKKQGIQERSMFECNIAKSPFRFQNKTFLYQWNQNGGRLATIAHDW